MSGDAPSNSQGHTRLEALLLAENAELTKALTNLTRGGSEYFIRKGDRYVADIPMCVECVRTTRNDAHRRTVNALLDLKAAKDHIAKLESIVTLARELVTTGMVNRGMDRGLVVVERPDKSDPHYRLCTALEALERDGSSPQQSTGETA